MILMMLVADPPPPRGLFLVLVLPPGFSRFADTSTRPRRRCAEATPGRTTYVACS